LQDLRQGSSQIGMSEIETRVDMTVTAVTIGPQYFCRIEACAGDLKEKLLKLFDVLFMGPKVSYLSSYRPVM